MDNQQPEALRLADALEELDGQFSFSGLCGEAAAELHRLYEAREECERQYQEKVEEIIRLHEVNAELVEALKSFTKCWVRPYPAAKEDMYHQQQVIDQAKAALTKATGGENG